MILCRRRFVRTRPPPKRPPKRSTKRGHFISGQAITPTRAGCRVAPRIEPWPGVEPRPGTRRLGIDPWPGVEPGTGIEPWPGIAPRPDIDMIMICNDHRGECVVSSSEAVKSFRNLTHIIFTHFFCTWFLRTFDLRENKNDNQLALPVSGGSGRHRFCGVQGTLASVPLDLLL